MLAIPIAKANPLQQVPEIDKLTIYHDSPLPKTSSWMEKCTKFGQLVLSKIIEILLQLPDFKAKMHPIRFWLGLRSRPCWGSLQRSPRSPSWICGAYF